MYIPNPASRGTSSNSTYRRPAPAPPRPVYRPPAYDPQSLARGAGMNAWYQAGNPGDRSMPGNSSRSNTNSLAGLFNATPPRSSGSSSGGGGGWSSGGGGRSYGGGSGGGVSAATSAAYKALLEAYKTGDSAAYDTYDAAMREAYNEDDVNAIYDKAKKGVQKSSKAGIKRSKEINRELDRRAVTGRTAVNDAFSQGDSRLAALQGQYQQQAEGANDGLNKVMDAFGAGPVQDTGAQSLMNLFANNRVAAERMRGINDAGLADRSTVYAGLHSDVMSGINRDKTGLTTNIAMQRADGLRANNTALQQLLGQSGIARLQAEQQRRRDELALRAELAQMGISV